MVVVRGQKRKVGVGLGHDERKHVIRGQRKVEGTRKAHVHVGNNQFCNITINYYSFFVFFIKIMYNKINFSTIINIF